LRSGRGRLDAWKAGNSATCLSDGVIEYSKTHEEIKGAFMTFQKDVVQIKIEGEVRLLWRVVCAGATFDWKKKAAAAAYRKRVSQSP
jgi:hypothetical protein